MAHPTGSDATSDGGSDGAADGADAATDAPPTAPTSAPTRLTTDDSGALAATGGDAALPLALGGAALDDRARGSAVPRLAVLTPPD